MMRTGEHVLRMSCKKGDSLLTNGAVFSSCSCGSWQFGPASREYARIAHAAHLDVAVASEQAERAE
jgi:hypothetical protein